MKKMLIAACLLAFCLPQAAWAGQGLALAALSWRNVAAIVIMVICLGAMAWMKHKNG
jgi:hypothetical protein